MSSLVSHVEKVEAQVHVLIKTNERLKTILESRDEKILELQGVVAQLEERLATNEERNIALRTANAMLGSDDYKTKTKLKINALVREIDQCIAQLT